MRFINDDNKQSLKQISFCTYINDGGKFPYKLVENASLITNIFFLLLFNCKKTKKKILLKENFCRKKQKKISWKRISFGTIKSHLCVYYTTKEMCFLVKLCRKLLGRLRKENPLRGRFANKNQRDVISIQNLIST